MLKADIKHSFKTGVPPLRKKKPSINDKIFYFPNFALIRHNRIPASGTNFKTISLKIFCLTSSGIRQKVELLLDYHCGTHPNNMFRLDISLCAPLT